MAYRLYKIKASYDCSHLEIVDHLEYIRAPRFKRFVIVDPFWGDATLVPHWHFKESVESYSLRGFYEGFLKNVKDKKALFVSDYSVSGLIDGYVNISFILSRDIPNSDEIDGAIVFIKHAKNIRTNGTVLFETPTSMVVVLKKENGSAESQHIWLDTSFAFLNDDTKLRFYVDDDI